MRNLRHTYGILGGLLGGISVLLAGCQKDEAYLHESQVVRAPVSVAGAPLKTGPDLYPTPKTPVAEAAAPSIVPPGSDLARFTDGKGKQPETTGVMAEPLNTSPATVATVETAALGGAVGQLPEPSIPAGPVAWGHGPGGVPVLELTAAPNAAWKSVGHALSAANFTILDQDEMMRSYYLQGKLDASGHATINRLALVRSGAGTEVRVLNEHNVLADAATAHAVLTPLVPYLK